MATNQSQAGAIEESPEFIAAMQRIKELEAQANVNASHLETEARARIDAEVGTFKASLLTKDDLRFNVDAVNAYGNLIAVAKCAAAGIATAKVDGKEITLDSTKSLGAYFADQVAALTKVGSKFTVPKNDLEEPAPKASAHGVTLEDFVAAGTGNSAAAKKIKAAILERKKIDAKFTRDALYAELGGK